MRKLVRTALVTAAAAATVVGLVATPASAAVTVTNGGAVTATNDGNLGAVTSRGTVVTCTTGTGAGSTASNPAPLPTQAGQLTSLALSGNPDNSDPRCVSTPGSILVQINVAASSTNPFPLFVTGATSGGVTQGEIRNVTATFAGSDGCTGTIGAPGGGPGVVRGTYDNSDGSLTADPSDLSLQVQTTNGNPPNGPCDPDLVVAGDTLALAGRFLVRNSSNGIPQINAS